MPKVCLSMIVRNEAHCIERCLNSVKWLVDCYRIVDTGSTDGTIETICRVMDGIPGVITKSQWQDNFALHRNEAIPDPYFMRVRGLRGEDYALMMDADDEMKVGMPFLKDALVDDCYSMANVDGDMSNYRVHLWKLKTHARWLLARHEILEGLPIRSVLRPEQICILIHHEGDRSKNPLKGINDAIAILKDLKNYSKYSQEYRYCLFLLGCCFVDTQVYDKAMRYYREFLKLADETDNIENIWMANNMMATCAFMSHKPLNEVVEAYMAAINADPNRLESYFLLARLLVDRGSLQTAKMLIYNACKLNKRPYALKHMEKWWGLRETFYQEICQAIQEEQA